MDIQSQLHLKIDDIQKKLRECNFECNQLKALIDKTLLTPILPTDTSSIPVLPLVPIVPPKQETAAPVLTDTPTPQEPVLPNPALKTVNTPAIPATPTVSAHVPPKAEAKAPKPVRSNQNIEDFIGGNLLNKIGIGILIIGIGIFVKYAIDKDWIGPVGRVMIGVLSSAILLGVAHYLRKAYKAFSSVLVGGGIAVLYFSVSIAFHQYALLSQAAAFGLMCGITAMAVFFSIAYNRQEIAIIGALGGFATPFLLTNGQGNHVVLFSYLIVLNIGMLTLSAFRDWKIVRALSFGATLLIYMGWMIRTLGYDTHPDLGGTLAFGTAFFLLFFAMNLVFAARSKQALGSLDYTLLLLNSAFFYMTGMATLNVTAGGIYMGLYTALMGAFHFAFIFPVRKLIAVDNKVQVLLIGLVLTFLTLTVPIQLEGRYLTMFWSLEAALVLFLGQRFDIKLLRASSKIIAVLAIIAIGVDWFRFYLVDPLPTDRILFLNGAFVTGLVAGTGLLLQHLLYKRDSGKDRTAADWAAAMQYAFVPLVFLVFALELGFHFAMKGQSASWTAVLSFSFLYVSALQVWAKAGQHRALAFISVALTLVAVIFYWVFNVGVLQHLAQGDPRIGWQFLIVPGMFAAYILGAMALQRALGWAGTNGRIWVWASAAVGILLCSLTLDNSLSLVGMELGQVHRVAYPILWGIIGAGMIVAGLRIRAMALRSGGLLLFLLILVKLFAFDIQMASTGGKIAAFICLGLLLLTVSFLYQKLKVLLTDESKNAAENNPEASNPSNQ